ncbi:hypothetical protein [Dialister sp.]|uniref:hypothetical protein n=1 Tax=Dialister sp. TaxID=1955814 RepID=UPI00406D50EC
MGTRNVPPFRNDVVGSFLRPQVIHEARRNLEAGKITASELRQIEDKEIKKLVAKEIENGLHAVTDGEFRRTYWHLDFLENLEGVEKVKAEEWSVHFKGHQPKAATVKITGKIGFGDHPLRQRLRISEERRRRHHGQDDHPVPEHAPPHLLRP